MINNTDQENIILNAVSQNSTISFQHISQKKIQNF